ncbi:hypothetical protein FJ208_00070 [Candidatus Gribaldobacteria bacterium]|nr:hypothetical protein [Candidatus Gribaldobacteria bacterium]
MTITIKQAQGIVDDWIKSIGVRYFSFEENMIKKTNRDKQRHQDNLKLKN